MKTLDRQNKRKPKETKADKSLRIEDRQKPVSAF